MPAKTANKDTATKASTPGKKLNNKEKRKFYKTERKKNPLIEARRRSFGIGQHLPPKRDLSRFVKWPKYIRLQRQRRILLNRFKVPPPINQFSRTLDKNGATQLLGLLSKYRPETKKQKRDRLKKVAETKVKETKVKEKKEEKKEGKKEGKKRRKERRKRT